MLAYFATHDLGLGFQQALYDEPAARLMLMLNQAALMNIGEEKCMTLSDIEAMEALKHG